jgi:DNA polymerase I-like protein with 3'-5' exonuclease and polymerase domains
MATKKMGPISVVDFETKPIGGYRPDEYPPKPVGVSIQRPGERKPKYWSFGHPEGNNCTEAQAKNALLAVWKSKEEVLCHHGKFDHDVAETHWKFEPLGWARQHDTVFLLALDDPYAPDLKLKSSAERILGMKPEERDAIREWAIEQRLMPKNKKEAGEFIHLAPGGLVGKYADGDVTRTKRLFDLKMQEILKNGMGEAYDRERRLMPVLLRNERQGVRADLALLRTEARKYGGAKDGEKYGDLGDLSGGAWDIADAWLRKTLKRKDLNVDSDTDLAEALIKSGKADEELFLRTPTGQMSTAKDSLIGAVTDERVLRVLQYRSKLGTAKGTFLLPWLREAEHTGGIVHPSWNQVRQHGAGGEAGAKTGRLSASRFMNVPKPYMEKAGKYEHPKFVPGLPELPRVRSYLLPDKGTVWCKRDYMQQELRVLAHFEDGVLLQNYLRDPKLDVHQLAADMVCSMLGLPQSPDMRDKMKTIGFGLLYGMGLGSLADRMGVDVATAAKLKKAYLAIFPGLKSLQEDLTRRGKTGVPLRTWGGRLYYAEEAKYIEKRGRICSFEYRLLNYLIQGSSADCTKEALIRYDTEKKHGRFLVTVHDEINICVPPKAAKAEMRLLFDVMRSVEFDIPMLSDGSMGDSWGSLKKLEKEFA